MSPTYEAIVIGAGPAGCAAAGLLARWGHRVLVLDCPGPHDHGLAVSIPPSARRTLHAVGFLSAVDAAGFHAWRGNSVWWAHEEPRTESFPPGTAGCHVVRTDLQRLARQVAVASGAEVRAARARSVRAVEPTADSQHVYIEAPGGTSAVGARFVLDCSGRAGVIARAALREIEASVRTVALTGIWHPSSNWDMFDETHTLVASYEDGWAWSIPAAPGIRYVTVMIDPQRTELSRGDSARSVYVRELAKIRPFAPLLDRGSLADGPWGDDASLYSARQYAGSGYLLVGDAGSVIDPLSSFGVKKALASAWVAAVATHTAIVKPELCEEALAFHDRRERMVYTSYRRHAAGFAAAAAEHTRHAFWAARASVPDADDGAYEAPDPSKDAGVLAALEDLRRRDPVRLYPAAHIQTVRRPAIRGNEIALLDHLVLPGHPDGIRYMNGVDLVALVDLAARHGSVGDTFDACIRGQGPVSLPDFLAALAFLIARGTLHHGEAGP